MQVFKRSRSHVLGPLLGSALCAAITLSCAEEPAPQFGEALDLYRQNNLVEALPLFSVAAETGKDAESYAYLAETYRRLRQTQKAADAARQAIDLDHCNSFAHTVLATSYNPMYSAWEYTDADSTWRHLMKAVECDSTDGNAWSWIWTQAVLRKDRTMERSALRQMINTGFLPPPLLSFNRWLLRNLPEGAILLTNGDWDTYPSVALQQIEGFRPDVAIVNRSLLNLFWYAEYLRDRYGLLLPFADEQLAYLEARPDDTGQVLLISDQFLIGWVDMKRSGELTRPIAVSVTVSGPALIPNLRDGLQYAGSFWLWHADPVEAPLDTALVRTCLSGIDPNDFAGPFASPDDRSPVRMTVSNRLVDNVTVAGLRYADALIKAGRNAEALEMLSWTEGFQEKAEWESPLVKRITQLREAAADGTQ
jgi:tetratricopeptide (TPR) repeat protein